jgi:predicted anti-sigma-YlaC factor YlaD
MKKALCFQCQKWSSDTKICEHCEYIISQEVKDEIKHQEYLKENPPKPPSKLARAMEYMRTSRNPILKLIYYVLMGVYMIYVGIVVIIMYIAAAGAG